MIRIINSNIVRLNITVFSKPTFKTLYGFVITTSELKQPRMKG